MPFQATVYQILVASPSDLAKEREVIPEIINDWNRIHASESGAIFIPRKWELDVPPQMGRGPQKVINDTLVKQCDILVGLFWTRVGQPTRTAASGTAEEIARFIAAGKRAMLYFSQQPIPPNLIDTKQIDRLKRLKTKYMKNGLIQQYASLDEFGKKLSEHLTLLSRELPFPPRAKAVTPRSRPESKLSEKDKAKVVKAALGYLPGRVTTVSEAVRRARLSKTKRAIVVLLNGEGSLISQVQAMREYFGDAEALRLVLEFFIPTIISTTDKQANRFKDAIRELGVPALIVLDARGRYIEGSTLHGSAGWGLNAIENFVVGISKDAAEKLRRQRLRRNQLLELEVMKGEVDKKWFRERTRELNKGG